MRRWLIRGVLIPGALVFLAGLWFFTSRWCALAIDQFYTPRLAIVEAAPIGWNGTWLQLGTGIFDRLVPNGDHLGFTGFARPITRTSRALSSMPTTGSSL